MAKQQTGARAPRPDLVSRILLARSTSRYVDGVWIGSLRTPADLDRIEAALALIRQHAPLHHARVVRDLARIWVCVLREGPAHYQGSLKACMLDERYLVTRTVAQLASIIVHEATHARLGRCGIGYPEKLRFRIEIVCIRRQLAFVAKLPNTTELEFELVRTLHWYGARPDWLADQSFRDRKFAGTLEAMRYLGAPEWVTKFMVKMRPVISWLRDFLHALAQTSSPWSFSG
jgi:hypothetical protein